MTPKLGGTFGLVARPDRCAACRYRLSLRSTTDTAGKHDQTGRDDCGLIELAEFEAATERVLGATDEDTLGAIIVTLPSLVEFTPASRRLATPHRVVSAMQNVRLDGRWQVASQIEATTGVGNCLVDFTNAVFDAEVTDLRVNAGVGRVRILVPTWVEMVRGGAYSGVVCFLEDAPPLPGLPVIRLRVGAALGKVIVRRPRRRRRS